MIKTHKELATQIAGKNILHLNSLGKDSILCLEWLTKFAHPSKIISVFMQTFAPHPDDEKYLNYLFDRYPSVKFIVEPNPHNITRMCLGHYQSPLDVMNFYNPLEYDMFDFDSMVQDLKNEHGCDYICKGHSRSESFRRATEFHKKGILIDDVIYPLGMMAKKEIMGLIKSTGFKLHPVYKLSAATLDQPSYFKYRSTFLAKPEYEKQMYEIYPLLELDKYRWEVLFNKR